MMKSSIAFLTVLSISWLGSVVQATAESSPGTQLSKHLFDEDIVNEQQQPSVNDQSVKLEPSSLPSQSNLVKRAAARPYSFGLGKKSMPYPSLADFLSEARYQSELAETESNPRSEYYDDGNNDFDDGSRAGNKRASGPISRGLIGKPGMSYSFGLGKRGSNWIGKLSSLPEPAYLGDIKRRYSFGLGK